jgi:hypothetical protein
MKNQEAKITNNYVAQLSAIMVRTNGTPAGLAALKASIERNDKEVK